ncbi:MAG: type II secretion system minor pseudopilin GspJ [Pseudomonadales bacterium]
MRNTYSLSNSDGYLVSAKGFTLLEVLVAISIFSFIALGGFRLLNTTAKITDAGHIATERSKEYERAAAVITSDLRNAIDRPMPSFTQGKPEQVAFLTHRNFMLEFSRGAYGPSAGAPRSNAVRIRYLLREVNASNSQGDDKRSGFDLIRQISAMDGEQQAVAREQLLLQNVEIATLRFMDKSNTWHSQWPVSSETKRSTNDVEEQKVEPDANAIPQAVELDIRTSISSGPILVAIRA